MADGLARAAHDESVLPTELPLPGRPGTARRGALMKQPHGCCRGLRLALAALLLVGGPAYAREPDSAAGPMPQATESGAPARVSRPAVGPRVAISFAETEGAPGAASSPDTSPFAGLSELSAEALIEQVLARNPSLAQMAAAARAAAARYPQVTSLDDPMFAATFGPDSFEPDDPGLHFAYRLELSQKYPWPGKLALRGQNALAEAAAAGNEVEDTRLQLIETTKTTFYDYYLVDRALEVNAEGLRLLAAFRRTAQAYFENPPRDRKVPIGDVYQADVELGRQRERRLTLERTRKVAVARINTLMHLPPDLPLPPAPKDLQAGDGLPDAASLRVLALSRRPDLQGLANRIRADEASLALACKEFRPDFEPFVMYDRFMGNNATNADLATMVGVRMNLPVRRERRYAALAEARARLAQRQAELARQTDEVNFQVEQAYAQVHESKEAVRLNRDTTLPAAQKNVQAARTAYESGLVPALSYFEAERSYVEAQDRFYDVLATYCRRRAALERVVGGPLGAVALAHP
jgi:outer membrane protein TolC